MADPTTDPRGYLDVCPELERFTQDPAVAAAITRGDGKALRAALAQRRRANRGPGEERAIDAILGRRRLFVEPVGKAPGLFTLNGVGTRMYGRADAAPDGTYVGTLFFTFLFLPIWPLAQYLVASEGSQYRFFGRVPVSGAMKAWRGAVGALVLAAVAAGTFGVWRAGQTATVHLLNGLDVPVVVELGGQRHELVAGHGLTTATLPTGRKHVKATTREGRVLEELDVELPGHHDLVAYSVLGAAPLVLETVYYGPTPKGGGVSPRVLAGPSLVTLRSVDHVFRPAPEKIQTRSHEKGGTRTRAWVVDGGWRVAVRALRDQKNLAGAERVATGALHAAPRSDDALDLVAGLAFERGGSEAVLKVMVDLLELDPEAVNAHRHRQDRLETLGRAEEARRIYRELEKKQPASPMAAYLRARAEDEGPEQDRLLDAGLRRFPDDPNLLRAIGWNHHVAGRTAAAVATWERLRRVAPDIAAEMLYMHAFALVELGRADAAAALVAEQVEARPDLSGALLYARVARLARRPAHPPGHYLANVEKQLPPGETAYLHLIEATVLGGPAPDVKVLAALDDEDTRGGALLLHAAFTDPATAVKRLGGPDRPRVNGLDAVLRVALGAEAARLDPAAAAPILADVDNYGDLQEVVTRTVRGQASPRLAGLPTELRAAILLGRARALEAEGKDARPVYAELRRLEVVPGIVSALVARWPRARGSR